MPVSVIVGLIALLIIAVGYFILSYRRHTLGAHAPERSIEVTVLDKQSVPIIGAQPGDEQEEYWIYVHPTQGGPKREFMVGVHYYHALNPGDRGTMTYKGLTFLHFALQRD